MSAVFLLVTGAGIAHADQVRADGDALQAKLQSGNPDAVTLAPGATHTFHLAAHVIENGNSHVTFPVGISVTTDAAFMGTPSPTSGNVTGYDSAGQLAVDVTVTAPSGTALTCGVTNSFDGKVDFTATTDTSELGTQGTNAQVVLKVNVAGPACPLPPEEAEPDTTPPTVNWSGPSTDPWYSSAQTASWTCSDDESEATGSGSGTGGTINASCTSAGGTTTDSRTYKVDTTPPVLGWTSAAPTGWYNTAQTATWTCTDAESGTTTLGGSGTTEGEGADLSVGASCTNGAGTQTTGSQSYNIDWTVPEVSLSGAPSGTYYYGDTIPTATCTASDLLSGLTEAGCTVATSGGAPGSIGTHSVTASAADNAGNTASTGSTASTYSVLAWTLGGFYKPVDMGGVVNTVKAGSTVPLKFNVWAGTTEKTLLSDIKSHGAKSIACGSLGDTIDPLEYTATGATSLRYDTTGGQFIYNWQTPKQAGSCWIATVVTNDGSKISALFKLK